MPWTMKEGDTDPPIPATLLHRGGPAPLMGAEVRFFMRQVDGTKAVGGVGEVVDAPAGKVQYRWRSDGSDTNTPGMYRGEWQVSYPTPDSSPRIETFPSDGYVDILILSQLDVP